MKECNVSKEHFKSSGYYNIYYKNSFGYNSIFYEISPIQVSLKEENPKGDGEGKTPEEKGNSNFAAILSCSIIGRVVVIGIVVFLVIRYCKRKNSTTNLLKKKIMESSIPLSSDA